jgi:endonuclease/exonuclease/phosphatase family metal-dependent hydrolase
MTGRVIQSIGADVIALVEADNRPSLVKFHDDVLALAEPAITYDHIMLIDGNDDRGIDVAIMTGKGFRIKSMRSHVDDGRTANASSAATAPIPHPDARGTLIVMINHFKSKGFGSQAESSAKRRLQAERAAAIYRKLRDNGARHVAVVGDFNDTPDSEPLAPLIHDTDLQDIAEHADFDNGGRLGTFGNGATSNKIDYILLSPALFEEGDRRIDRSHGCVGWKERHAVSHFRDRRRSKRRRPCGHRGRYRPRLNGDLPAKLLRYARLSTVRRTCSRSSSNRSSSAST